ncbi:MAG: hypothetical protein LQ347_005721, partial [Umbilicaria vellea]
MSPSMSKVEIVALCAWGLLASLALAAVTQLALSSSIAQRLERDQLGAVASENSICSRIGIELLKAGGNAADAVSLPSVPVEEAKTDHASSMLGLRSASVGIGGGGFMLIQSSNGSYESVDFRETAPAAAFENMYKGNVNGSVIGGLTRKRYANTLEIIAEKGADVFYTGAMAEAMVAAVQSTNGTMTMADIRNYTVTSSPPLEIDYRGFRVYSCGAPASGAVVLSTLKIVEGFEGFGQQDKLNLSTHCLDEAIRFGFGQ